MNIEFYAMTLWMAVIWPLLLSIPSLHSLLPWPRHLAIIPAAVLTAIPVDASMNIPWLFYGTGFAIDGNIRWILGAFVMIWLTAATIISRQNTSSSHSSTLYLLTMTGNLGALLTTDMVGFFSFSTLMGYGFYGLLIQDGDKVLQRAGRLYLYILIAADLALFEALLLVAFTTEHFQYEMARQVMSENSSSQIYFYMVFIGFALKAGIWPFYFWLSTAFNSGSRATALLLVAGPITIGLLGLLRWLPVREDIYIIGIVYPFISAISISLSILILTTGKTHRKLDLTESAPLLIINIFHGFEKWIHVVQQWVTYLKHRAKTLSNKSGSFVIRQYQHVSSGQKIKSFVTDWKISITLFLVLGLALAWLAK